MQNNLAPHEGDIVQANKGTTGLKTQDPTVTLHEGTQMQIPSGSFALVVGITRLEPSAVSPEPLVLLKLLFHGALLTSFAEDFRVALRAS